MPASSSVGSIAGEYNGSSTAPSATDDPGTTGNADDDTQAGLPSAEVVVQLRFADVDVPGALLTMPYKINDSGEIVGIYFDTSGSYHGFTEMNGRFSRIDVPGALQTYVNGVNNHGDIVGSFQYFISPTSSLTGFQGFAIVSGKLTKINVPNSLKTDLVGINDQGQILGTYLDAGGVTRAFIYYKGTITPITFPAALGTSPSVAGIDNEGYIVGTSAGSNGAKTGFLYDTKTGQYEVFAYSAAGAGTIQGTYPSGINDKGQIVGHSVNIGSFGYGFIDTLTASGNSYTPVSFPNASRNTYPEGINNPGSIVGYYMDQSGAEHGFIAMPYVAT